MDWFDKLLVLLATLSGIRATIELCGIILNTITVKVLAILTLFIIIPTLWFCIYQVIGLLPLT